jgi:hypothetical protein
VGGIAGTFRYAALNRALLEQGVQIAVGSIFSASGKYRNCLRMNYAAKPTPQIEAAVRKVGETAIVYWRKKALTRNAAAPRSNPKPCAQDDPP